jgi:hypothetical protein
MKTKEPRKIQKYPELLMHSNAELHIHYPDGTYEYNGYLSNQWILGIYYPRNYKIANRVSAKNPAYKGWIFLGEIK